MTIEPVLVPVAVGVNVTFNVQLVDGAMGRAVQVLETKAKSPPTRMSEMVRGVAPTLERVKTKGLLVVLTVWLANVGETGVTSAAAVVTPVPVIGMMSGLPGSLELTTIAPPVAPAADGVKVAVIVHVADGAMGALVQVLVRMAKSPPTMVLEITSGVAPTLDTVTVTGLLVMPTPCLPKTGNAGVAEAAAVVTPVPVNETISGLLGSLVVMVSEPVLLPAAVGVKVTFNVHVAPADIGFPVQVLEGNPKSPDVVILEISRGLAPTLVRVTDMMLLVVPTPCFPKASDVGVTEAAAVVTPVPDNATTRGLLGSSLLMIRVPVLGPDAVGVNVTLIVQPTELVIGSAVQVLDGKAKSPVVWMSVRVRALDPTLDRVTVTGTLVVPTPWFPKASDVAEIAAA